jgi:hypothetical protein
MACSEWGVGIRNWCLQRSDIHTRQRRRWQNPTTDNWGNSQTKGFHDNGGLEGRRERVKRLGEREE